MAFIPVQKERKEARKLVQEGLEPTYSQTWQTLIIFTPELASRD
jgi:hypothetical protein